MAERSLRSRSFSTPTDDVTSTKEKAVEIGKLLLPFVRKELEENNKSGNYDVILQAINAIQSGLTKEFPNLAVLYSTLQTSYQQAYFEQEKNLDQMLLRGAAYSFFSYVSWRLLVFYG